MIPLRNSKEREDELRLRSLVRAFARRGIDVRREKLSRGSAFRVKSGNCLLSGENIFFVDRRLPADQQLGLMVDYLVELGLELDEKELEVLGRPVRMLLSAKQSASEAA